MTLAYAVETFTDALKDIEPLIPAHWDEVGSYKDVFDRQIDFATYRAHEAAGRLLTVTARKDGVLVGYFISVLGNDSHRITRTNPPQHVGLSEARVYYICPEYRGYARGLVRAAEAAMAERGVSISNIRVKRGMNRADEFLAAIGYSEAETLFSRLIGDAADAGRSRSGVD